MKRSVIIIAHILAVVLALAGFVAMREYTIDGRGLSWINTQSFDDSVRFSDMVSNDIQAIKRYAVLKAAFEDDDELNTEKLIVSGTTVNGNIAYTAADIINVGKSFGYNLNPSTYELSYSRVQNEPNNYQIRVNYKLYDPYYFDNIEPGPSQGVTTVRDMCVEALRAVSEYYRLKSIYDVQESNFRFNAFFESRDGEEITVGNTDSEPVNINNYGKYLTVSYALDVNTNISPAPSNLVQDSNTFGYANTEGNVLEIGVDTTYIYTDRYKIAAAEYNGYIRNAYIWITVFALGMILSAATLVLVIRTQELGTAGRIHALDKLPVEGMFLVMAFGAVLVYVMFRAALYNFMAVALDESRWSFCCTLVKTVTSYGFLVAAMCSLYRRSCTEGMFANSIIAGGVTALGNEDSSVIWKSVAPYLAYIAVNAVCIGGAVWCLSGRVMFNRYYYFAAMLLIVLAIAVDICAYLTIYRRNSQRGRINRALKRISSGEVGLALQEEGFTAGELEAVKSINSISDGLKTAIETQVKADRLKADLITNVSHDIKTPLTSIINYVDLIKRENIDNDRVKEYIDILDKKSARLKNLTEDLVEASKASSGNIKMEMNKLDMAALAAQAGGEFDDKFAARSLEFNLDTGSSPAYVWADGRHLWRVFENLLNNAAKYAMEHTRIYAAVETADGKCTFTIKNVSQSKLNISPDELTERFIRGDVSRSTEGSGLGLNIAQSLTRLMGGELVIEIDGDLYKAKVVLPQYAGQGEAAEAAGNAEHKAAETLAGNQAAETAINQAVKSDAKTDLKAVDNVVDDELEAQIQSILGNNIRLNGSEKDS